MAKYSKLGLIRKRKMVINKAKREEWERDENPTGYGTRQFGYPTYCAEPDLDYPFDNYRYVDTGESTGEVEYPCPACGKYPTDEGHDPCIANLPGVRYACCGHGVGQPYLSLDSGKCIRGKKALAWFKKHNKGPNS